MFAVNIAAVDVGGMEFAQLEEDWRNKLDEIWLRYEVDRSPEVKQEYQSLLKQFADLILRGNSRPT
jgi:hypothetical protein